jgi:hypothetical protein
MPDQPLKIDPTVDPQGGQQGGETAPLREAAGSGNKAQERAKSSLLLSGRWVTIIG